MYFLKSSQEKISDVKRESEEKFKVLKSSYQTKLEEERQE